MLKAYQRRWRSLRRKFFSKEQVVQAWFEAVERGDVDGAAEMLSPDFVCRGWTSRPLQRDEFLETHRRLRDAFADWCFHARQFRARGDAVAVTLSITGTQTNDLTLPMAHAPLAPTGRTVAMPDEHPVFIVRQGRITEMHEVPSPGAGLDGLLQRIGPSTAAAPAILPAPRPALVV